MQDGKIKINSWLWRSAAEYIVVNASRAYSADQSNKVC